MAPKKSTQVVANAASKRKQAALEISSAQEKRALGVDDADILLAQPSTQSKTFTSQRNTNDSDGHTIDHISAVYRALVQHGFQQNHVETALDKIRFESIAVSSALDWLLLNLEPSELPQRFAARSHMAGNIEVQHRASTSEKDALQPTVAAFSEAELAAAEKKLQEEAAAKAAAEEQARKAAHEEEQRRKAQAEEEERARRAWILQYAEDSESDSSDVESEASGRKSNDSDIEVWEVWGDPREVERRKAQRSREKMPLEQRLALIATELAATKAAAAAAKSSGNKNQQKACGQMIGKLKKEIAELGVTEEEVEAMADTSAHPIDADVKEVDITSDMPSSLFDNEDDNNGAIVDGIRKGLCSSSSQGSSDDDGGLDFDLFDADSVAQLESDPSNAGKKRRPMAAEILQPWGLDSISGGGGKKGGKNNTSNKQQKAQPPQLVQPKALLQQLCQKKGWPPPRFEKLPPGGSRLEHGSGLRYSVFVDVGAPSLGPKKKGGIRGPRTFSLREEDDGWDRVEEAQNAAATLGLLEVFGNEDPELWQKLPLPYCDLWLWWLEEGEGAAPEESAEDEATRLAFVTDLVARKRGSSALEEGKTTNSVNEDDKEVEASSWESELVHQLKGLNIKQEADGAGQKALNDEMQRLALEWRESEQGQKWAEQRSKLPVSEIRHRLIDSLSQHDVIVVSGDTGSGKTTQVPQFILEDAAQRGLGGTCSIVCTQPRRIAAISVAERVAEERGEPPPGSKGARVGYSVRLDSAQTSDTRLLFCTTGILLRRLVSDPALKEVSHVIVDEVHERTLQGDFLMALLRDLVRFRRTAGHPLKVVLMSATLDSALFANYFNGCPTLHAQGRTFPVDQLFLEDVYEMTGYVLASDAPAAIKRYWDKAGQQRLAKTAGTRNQAAVRSGWGDMEADAEVLNPHYEEERYEDYSGSTRRNLARVDEDRIDFDLLEDLVAAVDEEQGPGAILVFLPGMGEISALRDRLLAVRKFRDRSNWIIPLHSTVAPDEQRRAFLKPPQNVRKIVLATNIAETSLTIEDVVYVIDTGKLKERRYDPSRGMSLLVEDWVSTASAKQRKGRAGRVRPGVCYGLYTRQRYDEKMKKFQAPEMVRVPLEELVLQIHLLKVGQKAEQFLSRVLQPPPEKAVIGAVRTLQEVGALTLDETLTPLGHHLAQLPVDARVGKLLLLSCFLGCLKPSLSIAACLSYKSPFASGPDKGDAAAQAQKAFTAGGSGTIAAGQQSDHLLTAAAVEGWLAARAKGGRKAAREFARKNCLVDQSLEMLSDMRGQFAVMLADIGFISSIKDRDRSTGRHWADDPLLPANKYSNHPAVIKAALVAALYPNVAVLDDSNTSDRRPAWHDGAGDVAIHPGSICHPLESSQFQRPFLVYLDKMRTSKVFIRDCTVASPAALLLFGGALEVAHESGHVMIDGRIKIKAAAQTAVLIKRLRQGLEVLLQKKVAQPRMALEGDVGVGALVKVIAELLDHEEAAQAWK